MGLLHICRTKLMESIAGTARVERRRHPRRTSEASSQLHWMEQYEKAFDEVVRIRNTSPDGLGIEIDRALPVGLTAWIEENAHLVKCVVRYCEKRQGTYVVGLKKIYKERRREDRAPCHEPGTLEWSLAGEKPVSLPVIVRNVSASGAQVEAPYEVPVSLVVKLRFYPWLCVGCTRYCRLEGPSYRVGLHLVEEPVRYMA